MGKHFSDAELDLLQKWKSKGVMVADMHRRLQSARRCRREVGPNLTSVRHALKGATFKRARVETRGGRPILSAHSLKALDTARKRLITKAKSDYEIIWDDVIRAARVPKVDRRTVAKAMKRAGYDVQWRRPRLKPERETADEAQRKDSCDKLRMKPQSLRTGVLDTCIDCKRWQTPRVDGNTCERKGRVATCRE